MLSARGAVHLPDLPANQLTRALNGFHYQASSEYWCYERHRLVRLVIMVSLMIVHNAQFGADIWLSGCAGPIFFRNANISLLIILLQTSTLGFW